MLNSIRISFLLPVLRNRTGTLCAEKLFCVACLALCLNLTNYKAKAETGGLKSEESANAA